MRVLIVAPDEIVAREIDRLMWTISATGFLPHCMSSDSLASDTPVLITRNSDTLPHDDLLLNLGNQPPTSFSRFKRLVEIVSENDDFDKQSARERFRFYKDRGYELHHHDLAENEDNSR
jgi:DNA polymerase-3 subunit chi